MKANPDKFQAIAIGKKTNKHKLTKELGPELNLVVPLYTFDPNHCNNFQF
jgi:hypothetical protein